MDVLGVGTGRKRLPEGDVGGRKDEKQKGRWLNIPPLEGGGDSLGGEGEERFTQDKGGIGDRKL